MYYTSYFYIRKRCVVYPERLAPFPRFRFRLRRNARSPL